jgi:hypothetical protein
MTKAGPGAAVVQAQGLNDVHNRDGIVVEDCGNIFRGKLVCRVADEKTCLSDRTVTDDHAPTRELLG